MLLLLVVFTLLALQNLLGYFLQVRQYQRAVKRWLGKGIVGIGRRRGLFRSGELLILVYNSRENKTLAVESLRGWTVFARFEERKEYAGLSLRRLRRRGIETGGQGALIQAIEAVEQYLTRHPQRTPVFVRPPVREAAADLPVLNWAKLEHFSRPPQTEGHNAE
ncbi:hypothetical protein AGMMS50230_11460 [Spirochaetia bacterium]|nr:hypothetical protein AGMMS50230_11460 [Spirochaetia bacterium]